MSDFDRILENDVVALSPMVNDHVSGLRDIALNPEIWTRTVECIDSEDALKRYVEENVIARRQDLRYTYTITEKRGGRIVGASAFANYALKDRRIEIGSTWITPDQWGRGINNAAKSVLIAFGFDVLGLERIEFKTDVLNVRSRAALLKIGATEEGVLRSHTLMHDGRRRDTIYYSVLRSEWATFRQSEAKRDP